MEKYFEEWDGKKYPVRTVMLPEELGGYEANVAGVDLYNAYEKEFEEGNDVACAIDQSIYFFFDEGYIESDPTDEEIIKYLMTL